MPIVRVVQNHCVDGEPCGRGEDGVFVLRTKRMERDREREIEDGSGLCVCLLIIPRESVI